MARSNAICVRTNNILQIQKGFVMQAKVVFGNSLACDMVHRKKASIISRLLFFPNAYMHRNYSLRLVYNSEVLCIDI